MLVRSGEVLLRGLNEQSSLLEQYTVDVFMSLLSLPFIFSGFYALHVRCDSYLRPFLYFLAASFLVATQMHWRVGQLESSL